MSIRAMNWAWSQKLAPAPKLILMALADSANDLDECWPGISFIAAKCCVSERTVQRVLQQFVTAGLMAVTPRYTSAGRQTSNGYRLRLDRESNPDKLSPLEQSAATEGVNLSGTRATPDVTPEGDKAKSPLEPQQESEQQPLHVPRHLSPGERRTVCALLNAMNHSDAQALLDELADAMESKTIKTNPLRWFHALVGKQKTGAFVPVGGIRIAERRKRQEHESEAQAKASCVQPPTTDRNIARDALAQAKRTIKGRQPATTEIQRRS
ncbi:hypothetical protein AAKU55_005627 [Oxalobacteraceae bacterium GrIS 1.11]